MTLNKMVKILLTYYYVSALLDDLNLDPLYKTSLQVTKFALFLYVIVNLSHHSTSVLITIWVAFYIHCFFIKLVLF